MTPQNEKAKVLLLHTGGTFGMEAARPMVPAPKSVEFLASVVKVLPELAQIAHLDMQIVCNLDSSDMNPELWKILADAIISQWESFDGFVIIHGTDTMAFTAAALSFVFSGLTKPIVLTGSQLPLSQLRTDARANLIDSVELATTHIPEVMICFDSYIHRGTRVTKSSNEHLHAFTAVNSVPLGRFGVHVHFNKHLTQKPLPALLRAKPQIDTRFEKRITTLTAVPGVMFSEKLIDTIMSESLGILIRAFGTGNLPLEEAFWKKLCQKALDNKIPVVMNSQCLHGRINLETYENGRAFRNLGVISALDMSFETSVIKLMVMLGRGVPFEERFDFFCSPLAEESSELYEAEDDEVWNERL